MLELYPRANQIVILADPLEFMKALPAAFRLHADTMEDAEVHIRAHSAQAIVDIVRIEARDEPAGGQCDGALECRGGHLRPRQCWTYAQQCNQAEREKKGKLLRNHP